MRQHTTWCCCSRMPMLKMVGRVTMLTASNTRSTSPPPPSHLRNWAAFNYPFDFVMLSSTIRVIPFQMRVRAFVCANNVVTHMYFNAHI